MNRAQVFLVSLTLATSACDAAEQDHDHNHDHGVDATADTATAADQLAGNDAPSADGGADTDLAGVAVPGAIAATACAVDAESAAPRTVTVGGAALVLQPGEVVLVDVPAAGKYSLALTTTGPHSNVYLLLGPSDGTTSVSGDLDAPSPIAPECGPWRQLLAGHIHEAGAHPQTLQVAGPQKVLLGYWTGH